MDQVLADGWDTRTKRDMKLLYRDGGTAGAHLTFSKFKTCPLLDAAKTAALTATVSWMEKEKRQTVKQTIG